MLGFTGGIAQWVFDRGRLGGPKGLLAAVISASGAHEELTKEELTARIGIELKAAPGERPPPQWAQGRTQTRAKVSCKHSRPGSPADAPFTSIPIRART